MEVVADLHLHSKYSRAVSSRMVVEEMALWAVKKGIDLVGTADWTHPLWLKELEAKLVETAPGLYGLKSVGPVAQSTSEVSPLAAKGGGVPSTLEVKFLLSTEIASIYSQGGRLRRIHNLILAPSFETVKKINTELTRQGVNLLSDGRPMMGISARDLVALVMEIDENCLVVPAHCLLPDESVHVSEGIKSIKEVKVGDKVYTHKNRWQKVKKTFMRPFKGRVYQIIPDYFRLGITVTDEHPFWVIKTEKNCPSMNKSFGICKPVCSQRESCRRRHFDHYQPAWVLARDLKRGDVLVFPRFTKIKDRRYLDLSDYLEDFNEEENETISVGKFKRHKIPKRIKIDKRFCRLMGYYLAEGCTTRDLISFCFSGKEKECLQEIKDSFIEIFGIENCREESRRGYDSVELTFYSKLLHRVFSRLFYESANTRRANNKCLPEWMLELPLEKQKEIFIGWWQGDKGYTTSRLLMNQMKIICLRLGIIPSIGKDSKEAHRKRGNHQLEGRKIEARCDVYHFSNLSFFENPFALLNLTLFRKYKTKMKRRRGWIDKDYVYLPIRKIVKRDYGGKVYNLEVEKDNSYTAEFACVHNCWTPWFALFGSKSGFDSLEECFTDMSQYIYSIETGLSSSPEMNWRVKDLDNRSILSFSDAHSPEKMGREATVFRVKNQKSIRQLADKNKNDNSKLKISYDDIVRAIKGEGGWEVGYTIEFYPEEGKYHYTGHRSCKVRQSPEETEKLGSTCPVCGKPLTVGVMHRVQQLADRAGEVQKKEGKTGVVWVYGQERPPYVMLVPLLEVIAEARGSTSHSQSVMGEYERLTVQFGSEFEVLLRAKIEKIAAVAGGRTAEAIRRVREGNLVIKPGYDGVFGEVKIWGEEREEGKQRQMSLF